MAGSELKIVEAEETVRELTLPQQQGEMLKGASWLAKEIKGIIEDNDLARALGGKKKHVELEGWTTILRIHNQAPHAKFVRCFDGAPGEQIIEAHAWVTDAEGKILSEADSFVSSTEKNWVLKPFYARASMAQTRALGKAIRFLHSWIMVMAGYEATPNDEMDGVEVIKKTESKVKDKPKAEPIKVEATPMPIDPDTGVPDELPHAEVDPNDPNLLDVVVKTVARNGRGILLTPADKNGKPIAEEVWMNTFHKGAFSRLSESVGKHVVVRTSTTEKNGTTYTNIEEVIG